MTAIGSVLNQLFDGNPATNPDWNVMLPIIFTSLIGIFARDNGVSSEQVGADEATKHIKKFGTGPVPMILLTGLLAFGAMTTFTGCVPRGSKPTPQAVAFLTLAQTKSLVDNAEKVYGNQVVLGHVSKAKQAEIDAKIVTFHGQFGLAVKIAKANYSAATPADVQDLANQLITTINLLSK